ncbi:hypothetical protein PHYPSEUDO_015237 [Phytophthora pseudosyringae]|uniref:Expansin-like EG45 domain-containing protein n=1 Tax=Phytophthora pseudosyringae TaxID=221518 RepID=A0A8T1V3E5_9STRA|nr:hypothetical protein PHYPSEUDO_015237 [Phytophthora pseudosyringae]
MMSALRLATTDYAALNNEQWGGLENCGRCAEVSCADSRCADRTTSIVVQLLDRCPECKHGDLDLSPSTGFERSGFDATSFPPKSSPGKRGDTKRASCSPAPPLSVGNVGVLQYRDWQLSPKRIPTVSFSITNSAFEWTMPSMSSSSNEEIAVPTKPARTFACERSRARTPATRPGPATTASTHLRATASRRRESERSRISDTRRSTLSLELPAWKAMRKELIDKNVDPVGEGRGRLRPM